MEILEALELTLSIKKDEVKLAELTLKKHKLSLLMEEEKAKDKNNSPSDDNIIKFYKIEMLEKGKLIEIAPKHKKLKDFAIKNNLIKK